jgi:hypothetical protein
MFSSLAQSSGMKIKSGIDENQESMFNRFLEMH